MLNDMSHLTSRVAPSTRADNDIAVLKQKFATLAARAEYFAQKIIEITPAFGAVLAEMANVMREHEALIEQAGGSHKDLLYFEHYLSKDAFNLQTSLEYVGLI